LHTNCFADAVHILLTSDVFKFFCMVLTDNYKAGANLVGCGKKWFDYFTFLM